MAYGLELRAIGEAIRIVRQTREKIVPAEYDAVRDYLSRVIKHLEGRAHAICNGVLRQSMIPGLYISQKETEEL